MYLPTDHSCKPDCDPRRNLSTLRLLGRAGDWRDAFQGWSSTPAGGVHEDDPRASAARAGLAVTAVALAMLVNSVLGTSSTVVLFCLVVAAGLVRRIDHPGLIVVATVALVVNTV